jgi:RNA polymerase sigma-70 factor (ECF subfamily)
VDFHGYAVATTSQISARQQQFESETSPPESGTFVAFDPLFERYHRYVAGIAVRLMGRDDSDVDDVVQDVFLLASRRMSRLTDMTSAKGWLAVVTTRTVRRKLVRRRFRRFFHVDSPAAPDVPAPGASPEEHAVLRRVYDVLETLPVDQQLAWSLRHLEGEQLESVANACGCSLATAKRRVEAASVSIRKVIGDA